MRQIFANVVAPSAIALMATCTVVLLAACQEDSPSLTATQALRILYDDLIERAYGLHGPSPTFDVRKGEIDWAFRSASSDASREAILSDDLTRLGELPLSLELAPGLELERLGLTRLAQYDVDGWWAIAIAHYGKWRVNERTQEVQPQDDRAKQVADELSPTIINLQAVVEYVATTSDYDDAYSEALLSAIQLADPRISGSARDRGMTAMMLLEQVTSLKKNLGAVPAPSLARTLHRMKLEALVVLEVGLFNVATMYAEFFQNTEASTSSLDGLQEAYAQIEESMSKWTETNEEMERLLDYIRSQQEQLLADG